MAKRRTSAFTPGAYRAAAKAAERRAGEWLEKMGATSSPGVRQSCYHRAAHAMARADAFRIKATKLDREIEELM